MTFQDIITRFEQYVDDTTELSTDEETALLQKIYNQVLSYRPWEFLKTSGELTFSTTDGVTSVALPSDFNYLYENNLWTDNSTQINNNASPKVLFVTLPNTTDFSEYQFINYSDRRQYRNSNGYAYIHSNTLYLTGTNNTAVSCELDYVIRPETITDLSESPVIPSQFQDILYHGMAIDDAICQMFPKARSYAPENKQRYNDFLEGMSYQDAQFNFN